MRTLLNDLRSLMTTASPHDLAELARAYGRHVYLSAYRVLGDPALAQDVQQDVFVRLLENAPDDVESWPAFLAALATRLAIDRLRRRRRWRDLLPRWLAGEPTHAGPADALATDAERATQLRDALATLDARGAECFVLRHVEGLEIPAIAAALGITPNLVSVTLHRAKQKLRIAIADAGHDTEETR